MAYNIVAMASFDNYASADLPDFFSQQCNSSIDSTNTPFNSGRSCNVVSGTVRALPATTTKLGITCYCNLRSGIGNGGLILYGYDGATRQTQIQFNNAGCAEIYRGDGTLLATSTKQVVFPFVWHHIEAKFTCTTSSSANDCQVWVDGVLAVSLGSSLSTRNTSNTQYTAFGIGSNVGGTSLDDLIVYDWSSGSAPPMGFNRVYSLSPSGNGTTNNFLGSDADSTNNYLLVNSVPFNTATYTGSSNPGDLDLYAMANLPTTPTITAVQVNNLMEKTDAGARVGRNVIRSGTTNYTGADCTLTPSYQQFFDVYLTDPDTTSTWTASGVNAIEAGVKVQS